MLTIENVVLPSPEQFEAIIRGTRNPFNSWSKSDSYSTYVEDIETLETGSYEFFIGEKDLELMTKLANAGPTHGKFKRMIPVYMDIVAPLYWWKEFDTYKVGTVANSCSTMHKIAAKEFEMSDFSTDRLFDDSKDILSILINALNDYRELYLESGEDSPERKNYWFQLIQLLPTSYNQRRTLMLNYEVLTNIYHTRRNHKLDEWHIVCDWIETLPYFEYFIK